MFKLAGAENKLTWSFVTDLFFKTQNKLQLLRTSPDFAGGRLQTGPSGQFSKLTHGPARIGGGQQPRHLRWRVATGRKKPSERPTTGCLLSFGWFLVCGLFGFCICNRFGLEVSWPVHHISPRFPKEKVCCCWECEQHVRDMLMIYIYNI